MRPNSIIPPLLFGLGVEVDHAIGSKTLLVELAHLGYSISWDEAKRFKQSVAIQDETDTSASKNVSSEFTQWVADNCDHNAVTLDGKGTFHLMGIIECSIKNGKFQNKPIKRIKHTLSNAEITRIKKIPHEVYTFPDNQPLANVTFKPLGEDLVQLTVPNIDYLWYSAAIFRKVEAKQDPRPSWNGYMELTYSRNDHPSPSQITMLPFIDLNPNDPSCIYSTLLKVIEQARQQGIVTPSVTFDQPLWLKAVEIIDAKKLPIVARLGGFHSLMSFAHSIGTIMECSGLEKLLETCYAPNSVLHILSGKAIARALRAHFIADAALTMKLLAPIFPKEKNMVPNSTKESGQEKELAESDHHASDDILSIEEVSELEMMYSNTEFDSNAIESSTVLAKISNYLVRTKENLSSESSTAKLWIRYMGYVDVIKHFIRAERRGEWLEHLAATKMMLNLYAATGHHNYAKSARLYLQMMNNLSLDYPWLYNQYTQHGFHSVWRTDKAWAGLWTDLIIEQTMMRSVKSIGGLTLGVEWMRVSGIYGLHLCIIVVK